jgi:hypothetical protein
MTVNCVSSSCRKPIESTWDFCPYCGSDNRAPSDQPGVDPHKHQFLQGLGYCLLCGEAHDEPYAMSGRWRVRLATCLLLLSLLLGFLILNIQMAGNNRPAIAKSWIRTWYDQPVSHRSKYSGRYTTQLGQDVSIWLGIAAGGVLFISIAMYVKHPFRGSAYWQYDDDKPWWRRNSRWW